MESAPKAMALISSQDTLTLACRRDRMSVLPESVIFRIFSFLRPNESAILSLVSRRFRQLCINSPYLYFCANFDSKGCLRRYTQFCYYVDKMMRTRDRLGIEIDKFLIHWFCKQPRYNIGGTIVDAWVKIATKCNVGELDILVNLDEWLGWGVYSLPECVFRCKSLRVLKLNLQMGKFYLVSTENMDSVEDLLLDSMIINERNFGEKISGSWTSLRRLILEKVHLVVELNITSSSLEELKMSNCEGGAYVDWHFSVSSSSLKNLCISRCHFKVPTLMNLRCPSLENFTLQGSDFDKLSTFKIASLSIENFRICGSNFLKGCCFCISCPSVKHIKIGSSNFEDFCFIEINSSSLGDLTVSDCELSRPQIPNFKLAPGKRIHIVAEKLQTLTINSSDKHLYNLPLSISTPNIQDIKWTGNPVDFSYLESFLSLVDATIYIKPSCQHKSKELACRCKLVQSLIYCAAMLLQSLKYAKFLKINIWPIEMFFMQNNEPIYFNNLLCLLLTVDSLTDQTPLIASFLKGLPNLRTLIIKCRPKSHVIDEPNFISLLGLCPKTFNLSLSEEGVKIFRRNAQDVEG
ncbi:hypothetical protein GH714_032806 [Hevea brasiliensis]|uniref:F-box domain-containing protein n=1 Tax=Hevea brasiliensis TaxID=3981 RepID=A0A6A6LSU1_HEVBR|nr:hypothetical protein GH714_032806 [Hevea brasiliensis]